MRILYFAPIDPGLPQGHAVHLRRLTEALEARGHEVGWITLEASGHRPSTPRGGWTEVAKRGWPKLRHLEAEVHLQRALAQAIERYAWDVLLVRLELLSLAALSAPTRVPLFIESNSSLARLGSQASSAGRLLAKSMERAALRRARGIGTVTEDLRRIQVERAGLDPERVRVIANGAALPALDREAAHEVRRRLGGDTNRFLVVFAGNLCSGQGLELLIDAVKATRSKELSVWIAGHGRDRSDLEARARFDPRIRLLGPLPEAEVLALLQAAELAVAPYDPALLRETGGEGLKILQALACDRPVLTSAKFDAPDLGSSLSTLEHSMQQWALALDEWVSRWRSAGSPERDWPWREGQSAGRAWIATERSWDHTARAWERFFDDLRA